MIKVDEKSNAQSWELEVTCKNRAYRDAIVKAALEDGFIEFEVELVDIIHSHEESMDARYTVLMWGSWFNRLANIAKKLNKIEKNI